MESRPASIFEIGSEGRMPYSYWAFVFSYRGRSEELSPLWVQPGPAAARLRHFLLRPETSCEKQGLG